MKNCFIIILIISITTACNNAGQQNNNAANTPKTHEDSLLKEVMEGHDITMGKMSRISAAQKKVQQAIDSVHKLPAKAQQAATGYQQQLDSLAEQLKYADFSMNKWMEEFNYDSATIGSNRSIYLEGEKKKITAVEDAMLSALVKTDSLFKK